MTARGLRRLARVLLLAAHILLAVGVCSLILLCPPLTRRCVRPFRTWWLKRGTEVLGVKVVVRGEPAQGALLLANHISWLDILVLATRSDAGFVAKAEVAEWPLLGWLIGAGGTEFLRRGSHGDVKRVLARMAARLGSGESLVVFPEGTSTGAALPLRFRPRLIQAAADAGVPVQPVAIHYGDRPAAAFVGDDSLLSHLWRLLAEEPLLAEVAFLPGLSSVSGDCRLLADESWRAVTHALTRLELFERHSRLGAGDLGHDAIRAT